MPFVQTQLLDGPPEPVVDENFVLSDLRKQLNDATTIRRLDNLADRQIEKFPDFGPAIMAELGPIRNVIEQKQAQDPRLEEEAKAREKRDKVHGPEQETVEDIQW